MSWSDDIKPERIVTFQYYYGFGAYPIIADKLFTVFASMYDRWSNYFIEWSDSDYRITTPGGVVKGWLGHGAQIYYDCAVSFYIPTIHMLMGSAFQKHVLDVCTYHGLRPRDLQWVFCIQGAKQVPLLEAGTDCDTDTEQTFFTASE